MGNKQDPKNKEKQDKEKQNRKYKDHAKQDKKSNAKFMWLGLLVFIVLVALIVWQWRNITRVMGNVVNGTYGALGWGLILVLIGIIVAVCVLFRERLAPFAKRWTLNYWYRWLGAIVLVFFIWGILGLLALGGSVGKGIVSGGSFIGILRLIGLLLLAFALLLPAIAWRSIKAVWRKLTGAVKKLSSKPKKKEKANSDSQSDGTSASASRQKQSARSSSSAAELADSGADKSTSDNQAKKTSPASAGVKTGDKQIAQDVWRKYGEFPNAVEVDGWKLPPIELLDKAQEMEFSDADNQKRAKVIEDALNSYGVAGKVTEINVGPTVTQFGIEPGWDIKTKRVHEKDSDGNITVRDEEISRTRVKVERITALSNNLALALAASTIRIEAPVPGKAIVGLEVPNTVYSTVTLRGIIEAGNFKKLLTKTKLAMALGKGAGGEAVADDLAKMPHLLIAGSTGSGKTVCLNAVICCILMCSTPYDVKLILIDPKRVELTQFNSLPHLAAPVVVDTDKALSTLRWLNMEMDNRYKKLQTVGARNIDVYNENKTGQDKMHYIVLVIDELADLMMAGFDEVEHILCRLAQLARAVGIHLVVATQRPSVDVITGLIKANFPTRISFAVTSQVDSRTILDAVGAEKLLGRGDMLYAPRDAVKPKRLQGCYVSDPEVERLVYFWNSQKKEEVTPLNAAEIATAPAFTKKESQPVDPLMDTVRQLSNEHEQLSASFLQRKLGIGYPRAARLYDQLKEEMESMSDGGAEIPKNDDLERGFIP